MPVIPKPDTRGPRPGHTKTQRASAADQNRRPSPRHRLWHGRPSRPYVGLPDPRRVKFMTDQTDLLSELGQEDTFEKEMRGYSRRQVDEFVARSRSQARDLEEQLSRSLDEIERLRLELSAARQAAGGKPAYEEISERMGQILKLADDEAKAQKIRAQEDIAQIRNEAKAETEKFRAEAREQSDRMLSAAQEQAEHAIASARTEAEKTRSSARSEAERSVSEAHKQSESALGTAKAQAKQVLDEATARATAIHDGAERRLNLLTSRHTEAIRRLTEIRDVVTTLVAGEAARGSMEEEVAKSVANAIAAGNPGNGGQAEGRHAPASAVPAARPSARTRGPVAEQAKAQPPAPAERESRGPVPPQPAVTPRATTAQRAERDVQPGTASQPPRSPDTRPGG
jgi:cell division septum initiation protein DivIVA